MSKQHKIPPYFPLSIAFMEGDQRIKRLNRDLPNCQGLGILIAIFSQLIKNKDISYPLEDIDILANDINTSIALTNTVIHSFKLFIFIEQENEKMFFSPDLNEFLKPYFNRIKKNTENAKKSVEKRKITQNEQIEKLKCNKFSRLDSIQQPFNDCLAIAQPIEQKEEETRRKHTTTNYDSTIFEIWLKEKSRDKVNPDSYVYVLRKKYLNNDENVIIEFNNWLIQYNKNLREKIIEKNIQNLKNKKINTNFGLKTILGIEVADDNFTLFFKEGGSTVVQQIENLQSQIIK